MTLNSINNKEIKSSFAREVVDDKVKIDSINQIHTFFGLEKPKHPLVSAIPITDKITSLDFSGATYLFDIYQISLKINLSCVIDYGRNSYDFQEGTMVFTKPGQSLKIENDKNHTNSTGWILAFHPDLIRKSELGMHIDRYSFFGYDVNEALHLSDSEQKNITELILKIENEYSQYSDHHSHDLIVSNIKLLLDYCTRYYDRQFYTRTNLSKDLISKFETLLRQYYLSDKPLELGVPTVKYFGSELNISSHYMSDTLRKETGKNAQDHIYYFLIDKAKTKLLNTQESVSQIAYSLGFNYPNHFSKVFRNKTGMSPIEYRNLELKKTIKL